MVMLRISCNNLVIVLHQEIWTFSLNQNEKKWVFRTEINCAKNLEKSNSAIQCSTFSPCGQYFGICLDRNVIIYCTDSWNVLYKGVSERNASALQFFPVSKAVIIADKSGCATCYSFLNEFIKNDISLGHNSMLTDVALTNNEKFLITSDRDEKIRVSNYPNVYNIESYCLGHKMFVSCIQILPTNEKLLISSSGDGTVRLWEYLLGKEVACYNFNEENQMDGGSKFIIVKFVSCKYKETNLVAVLLYKSTEIKILQVQKVDNGQYVFKLFDKVKLNVVPWDIAFQNESLVYLSPNNENPLSFWSPSDSISHISTIFYSNTLEHLKNNWDFILKSTNKIVDNLPVLLKREVDNIQEYEQRKKARLLKTGKTS